MSDVEYTVNFGSDKSIQFVKLSMAEIERHGARLGGQIVRCRDCKFGVDGGKYCAEGCADSWDWRNAEPDGFCAWGERSDE